eukprot:Sspe_Gene.64576::Locus_38265_Transcript_1_1_Confidence_1.000_Length_3032::g.64576::m.64576
MSEERCPVLMVSPVQSPHTRPASPDALSLASDSSRPESSGDRESLLMEKGKFRVESGKYIEAAEVYKQAARLYETKGMALEQAGALAEMGNALMDASRIKDAEAPFAKSLEICSEMQEKEALAEYSHVKMRSEALGNMAYWHYSRGNQRSAPQPVKQASFLMAKKYYQQQIAWLEETLGQNAELIRPLCHLASLHCRIMGDDQSFCWDEALQLFDRAIEVATAVYGAGHAEVENLHSKKEACSKLRERSITSRSSTRIQAVFRGWVVRRQLGRKSATPQQPAEPSAFPEDTRPPSPPATSTEDKTTPVKPDEVTETSSSRSPGTEEVPWIETPVNGRLIRYKVVPEPERRVIVEIPLPEINSMKECSLEINETMIVVIPLDLSAPPFTKYMLRHSIDISQARAKFTKSKKSLTITAPILDESGRPDTASSDVRAATSILEQRLRDLDAGTRYVSSSNLGEYNWSRHRNPEGSPFHGKPVPETIAVEIFAPEINSMAEAEVEHDATAVELFLKNSRTLLSRVDFGYPIDTASVTGRFKQRHRIVAVKASVLLPDPDPPKTPQTPDGKRFVKTVGVGEYDWSKHAAPGTSPYHGKAVPEQLVVSIATPEVQTISDVIIEHDKLGVEVYTRNPKKLLTKAPFSFPVDAATVSGRFRGKDKLLIIQARVKLPQREPSPALKSRVNRLLGTPDPSSALAKASYEALYEKYSEQLKQGRRYVECISVGEFDWSKHPKEQRVKGLPERLELRVFLPEVSSMVEARVKNTESQVEIFRKSTGEPIVKAAFKHCVDPTSVTGRFNTKTKVLVAFATVALRVPQRLRKRRVTVCLDEVLDQEDFLRQKLRAFELGEDRYVECKGAGEYDWGTHDNPVVSEYFGQDVPEQLELQVLIPEFKHLSDGLVENSESAVEVYGKETGKHLLTAPFTYPVDPESVKGKFRPAQKLLVLKGRVQLPGRRGVRPTSKGRRATVCREEPEQDREVECREAGEYDWSTHDNP